MTGSKKTRQWLRVFRQKHSVGKSKVRKVTDMLEEKMTLQDNNAKNVKVS